MKVEIKSVEDLEKQKMFLTYFDFGKVQTVEIESCSAVADGVVEMAEEIKKNYKMNYVVVDYNGDEDKFLLKLKK